MTAWRVGAPLRVAALAVTAMLAVIGCSVAPPSSPPVGPSASSSASPSGPSASVGPSSPPASSSGAPSSSNAGRDWAALPNNSALEAAFIGSLTAAGPGLLFASGYVSRGEGLVDGAIWASRDGRAWTRLTDRKGFEDAAVGEITRGSDGTFLAVGSTCYYECAGVRMWQSADGAAWSAVAHDLPDSSFVTVIPGGPRWIAVGEMGLPDGTLAAWASPDDKTWLQATGMGAQPGVIRGLVATADGFLAAGSVFPDVRSEPAVWTSPDGAEWTRLPLADGPQGLGIDALTQLDGVLTAFVRTESGIEPWTSQDGRSWVKASDAAAVFAIGHTRSVRMSIVVAGGPGLIVFGVADTGENSAPIGSWLSADGFKWQAADDVSAFPDNAELYDGTSFGDEVLTVGRLPCDIETCVERPAFWVSPPR
jgi:hypothetical protein